MRVQSHLSLRSIYTALLFAAVFCQCLPAAAAIEPDINATWHGFWRDHDNLFEADMKLSSDATNKVTGSIRLTLKKALSSELQNEINLSGTEVVRGEFSPSEGIVRLEGISKNDPNEVLSLDKFRLILSDDGKTLGGITWNRGTWTGQILLFRPFRGAWNIN
jgi:hypothetical protein